MADLYIFGDSYSTDWEEVKSKPWTGQAKYYKWLGKTPEHFSNLIKDEFKLKKIHNYAVGGNDNYTILESIGKHIHRIKKDDYVAIGWSHIARYRIVVENDTKPQWVRILSGMSTVPTAAKEKVSKEFLYQCVDRECILTKEEIVSWQNILKIALPKNTIYWSPFGIEGYDNLPYLLPNFVCPIISDECDIDDAHFSEIGMVKIGKWLVEKFKDNPYNNTKSNYYIGNKLI